MLINHAEMEYLKLTAWCKDLPQNTPQYLHADTWEMLCRMGYIRENRTGSCYRPTAKALELLESAGYTYPQDKRTLSSGDKLTRRLELSEIILFLYSMGADVFLESPTQIRLSESSTSQELPTQQTLVSSFLPSFVFRRAKASNLLGGTRMTGFLYTPQNVFIPYFISTGKEGIYPHTEQTTFRTEYLSCGKTPVILYTGKPDLSSLLQMMGHAAEVKFKNGATTYKNAMEKFSDPICFVPLSKDGARQLRIICRPDYRQSLAKVFLNKDGYAPTNYLWCDAINKKFDEPFIVGVDMNLKGFDKALKYAGEKKLHIAVLDFQLKTANTYLKNKNAKLYAVSLDAVESALDLPGIPGPDFKLYQTKEGKTLNVTAF